MEEGTSAAELVSTDGGGGGGGGGGSFGGGGGGVRLTDEVEEALVALTLVITIS